MSDLPTPSSRNIGGDVWLYPDAFPEPLCDRLIDRFRLRPQDHVQGARSRYDNRQGAFVSVSEHQSWRDLDDEVLAAISPIVDQHYARFGYAGAKVRDEGYELVSYAPGQVCREHSDGSLSSIPGVHRHWALVAILSNASGGLVFPRQKVRIPSTKGSVGMWPVLPTHPHFTTPSKQERFVLVTFTGVFYGA